MGIFTFSIIYVLLNQTLHLLVIRFLQTPVNEQTDYIVCFKNIKTDWSGQREQMIFHLCEFPQKESVSQALLEHKMKRGLVLLRKTWNICFPVYCMLGLLAGHFSVL